MAVLINGNGNEAIYAQQDADWFASIMGNQTAITGIGNKFAASLLDANTIGVSDGVIITQEGRRIQLDVNEIDSFDIPAGGQGETNYYIIGYHLVTGDLSEQYCETFVRLMDNDTDTIPEDTFRGGADEVFVSLYRVTQDDLVITDMALLLPEIGNFQSLRANNTNFKAAYQNGKYGFVVDNEFLQIGGGSMPTLDFANPLHTFSSVLTYTATKTCYLLGSLDVRTQGTATAKSVSINGTMIFRVIEETAGVNHSNAVVPLTKLEAGDIVTITSGESALHVFDVVS